jgi:hypothetical protein
MPEITRIGTAELYRSLNETPLEVVADAYRRGRTLSRHFDAISPSDKGELPAFERLLREAGIVTRSDPEAGYWASRADTFLTNSANRVLLSEFFARQWRKISFGGRRAIYLSSDGTPGSWERPYAEAQQARWDFQLAPAIPLSELVAITTPIEGQDYRSFYLTYDATQLRQFRIGESANIPIAKLTDAERTVNLKKYGRGLQASYEQMRRMRVDKLAMQIQLMAVQSEVDKVAAGLAVLVNGDGNSGTSPTTHNLTTLDTSAVAGTLTIQGWVRFKMKFAEPYVLTTALMQENVAGDLALLNAGSANLPLAGYNAGGMVQGLTPINMTSDAVRYGWTSAAPALKIVAFDRRMAMEQLTEIGSQIDEMERFVTNQTQVMTLTEVQGFDIMDGNATLVLDVNA